VAAQQKNPRLNRQGGQEGRHGDGNAVFFLLDLPQGTDGAKRQSSYQKFAHLLTTHGQ